MNINCSLISAVREGRLERVRELISSFGLSYFRVWSGGYVLLRHAIENKHTAVTKLLLTSGSKVNSKNQKPSNTPLHFAVINGDIEIVEMLLDKGANINAENRYGRTPLHDAIENQKMEVTELLLKHGANIDAINRYGRTPLHNAIENQKMEVTELLLKHGAYVNARDSGGTTPLHIAAERGCLQIVEHLLKRGANVNCARTSTWLKGYTPLHCAVEKGNEEVINLLLSRDANVNAKGKDGMTSLYVAGCLQIVEHLLKHGAYVNCVCTSMRREGYTPLHIAVEKGSEEVINLLLSRGANVDAKGKDGMTSLYIAGCLQIVEHLLKHGAYVNCTSTGRDGYTPLHIAAEKGSEEIIKFLLSNNAHINASAKDNLTPLYIATKNGREKVVKLLLDHGANVDAQDKDGKTILHLAVQKGHPVIIEYILKYCPDVNNKYNRSSLNAAVHGYGRQYSKIVESLLQYGFSQDVNPEDINNYKLLHAAIEKGYLKIVEDLLKYGTDVNMLYESTGYTPLHNATKNKQEKVATLLINYGADVNAKTKLRKTPIFYAIENIDLKITKLLLTNGADIKDSPELLNTAVEKECREIVEVLLQHDADINASDKYGRTALHFTALGEHGYFGFTNEGPDINKGEIAKLLLSRGANVDAQYKAGITTLHIATQKGYAKVVEALLGYNANVNSGTKNNITPLHISAEIGNEVISTMLLNKGANVNAEQKDGMTALHIATENGHKEVVEALLKCGAKVDSKIKKDTIKITPLHIAAQKGYPKEYEEIVKILLKFGADIDSRDQYGLTALHIASKKGADENVVTLLEYGSDINIVSKSNHTPLDFAMAGISSFYNIDYDSDGDYYEPDRGYCPYEIIAEILKQQIIKMKTANLYVSRKNLLSISSNDGLSDYQNECEEEMESMKSEKISNNNVSFHDIVTKNLSQLAIYARNENIVQVLKSDDYKTKFPIYASMINSRFWKGVERKELLEQGNRFFHSLFNRLPKDCTEKIFSYLSDKDLRVLIDVCEHINIPNIDISDVASTLIVKGRHMQ